MSNEILLRLRKFHPNDANIIAGWLKSEYQMRQWCADRYSRYPVTADDINSHHDRYIDGHSSIALTMVDAAEVIGYITLRKPTPDCYEAAGLKQVQREETESYTCLGEIWNCIEMELII